jgi:hypothetical protein
MNPTRHLLLVALTLAAATLAGCPGKRTAAATQPTPAAFDIAASDPKAVQVADALVAKLGGWERWSAVKQLQWSQQFTVDGEVRGQFSHAWDRWNGRHALETRDMAAAKRAKEEENPRLNRSYSVMYDLFDREGSGSAFANGDPVPVADKRKMVVDAYNRWLVDHYLLTVYFRTKDPGAKLAYEERPADNFCPDVCDVLKVSFDPAVGKDTYYIDILRSTGPAGCSSPPS